ncbi:MAG: hypothetical protein IEMM0008_0255 [bacterium]|nr:MAG: hypothetical protein IEMM0008_0255 [bacterium]
MSADLKKIVELEEVQCAVEFDSDGHLIRSEGEIPERVANMLADLFSANLRMAKMQAHLFSEETGMAGFGNEITGFAMMGSELSFCVIENVGVVVINEKADLNKIYEVLASI